MAFKSYTNHYPEARMNQVTRQHNPMQIEIDSVAAQHAGDDRPSY